MAGDGFLEAVLLQGVKIWLLPASIWGNTGYRPVPLLSCDVKKTMPVMICAVIRITKSPVTMRFRLVSA